MAAGCGAGASGPAADSPGRRGGDADDSRSVGVPVRWQIVGDTVYLSAPESRWLQALDVGTGTVRWRAPLGEREFFAGILGNSAVILGTSEVRRHALADGGLLGKNSLPAPPAGQPLLLADRLLVPLMNGRHWVVDLATGDVLDDAWLQVTEGCEHLYPVADFVVAMRPDSVTVYPTISQAGRELELARTSGRRSEAALLEAELAVLKRELPAAADLLEQAISAASSESLRLPIQRRLREVLLAGLQRGEDADGRRFRRLLELSVAPAEIAEVRFRESVWLRERGRWAELLELLHQTEPLPGDALTAIAGDPERQVSMDGFRNGLSREIVDSPIRPAFVALLKQQFDRALRAGDVSSLLRLVELARPVGELDTQRLEAAPPTGFAPTSGGGGAALAIAERVRRSACRRRRQSGSLPALGDRRLVDLGGAGNVGLQRSGRLDPAWDGAFLATAEGAAVRELTRADWPLELHARIEVHPRERTIVIPPLTEGTGRRSKGLLGQLEGWTPRPGGMPDFGFQGR